ncbi:hypothetical protein AAG596_14335 [Citromicrobium bathyomarinum]|uniref:hypothetical protein n=1 Tax=Citromicrobium bathyomarinum TaxID=72174 RepID=UPI00315A974A
MAFREAEPMMHDDDTLPFTEETLDQLYAEVSDPEGITLARLEALIDAFGTRDRAPMDTQSYREGRKPWKKLRDEIVPVQHFLASTYPADVRVRFPLDDQPPDAWLKVGDAPPVGIEVTGALARASIEVGRSLAGGGAVPGFIGLQDDASSAAFAQARARQRVTNSRKNVERTIDTAIGSRLVAKDHEKYTGHILLVTAPTGSSPYRKPEAIKQALGEKAKQLPFAEIYVLDTSRRKPPIRLK